MRHANVNFDADASLTKIATTKGSGHIMITGDFGSGTVTLFVSMDGGTTKPALRDLSGVAYSTTTADIVPFDLTCVDRSVDGSADSMSFDIYATLASSSSPDLNIQVMDNQP